MGRFKFNLKKGDVLIARETEDNKCLENIQQCKEYHINNSIIKIIFGNLLDSQAEVIVNSDDSNITMGGGVSMAIRRKEGTGAIRLDVSKKTPAEIGDVVVSSAVSSSACTGALKQLRHIRSVRSINAHFFIFIIITILSFSLSLFFQMRYIKTRIILRVD